MTLKQFLKPDWRKIVLVVIFNLIFVYVYIILPCGLLTSPYHQYCYYLNPVADFIQPMFIIGLRIGFGDLPIIFGFLISLLYQYLLSCLIVWIYDKLKKK